MSALWTILCLIGQLCHKNSSRNLLSTWHGCAENHLHFSRTQPHPGESLHSLSSCFTVKHGALLFWFCYFSCYFCNWHHLSLTESLTEKFHPFAWGLERKLKCSVDISPRGSQSNPDLRPKNSRDGEHTFRATLIHILSRTHVHTHTHPHTLRGWHWQMGL